MMKQVHYKVLFRWFTELAIDEEVWDHSVVSTRPALREQVTTCAASLAPQLEQQSDQLRLPLGVRLQEDVLKVRPGGSLSYPEDAGDLRDRVAGHELLCNPDFSLGKPVELVQRLSIQLGRGVRIREEQQAGAGQ